MALARARRLRQGPVWLRSVTAGDGPPRVAFAIPRSVGNAVERNRVRRRLRAAVAGNASELRAGGAYLFGADRRLLHAPFTTLESAVRDILRAESGVTP